MPSGNMDESVAFDLLDDIMSLLEASDALTWASWLLNHSHRIDHAYD